MATNSQLAMWDFTFPADNADPQEFINKLKTLFKKFVFQKEQADSNYLHYQGRGSLFKKRRLQELTPLIPEAGLQGIHLSPTSNPTTLLGEAFYTTKVDTRIEGPWSDRDIQKYIPRQYRGYEHRYFPYQQKIIDSASVFESRKVNFIYDPDGGAGKSTIASICCLLHNGIRVPPINDSEKLLASVCDILTAKDERRPGPVFIDLPRFMDKKKLHGIFSAIEEIKNGHVYDVRYHYKEWWFDSPPIWVFSNMEPPMNALSRDRWLLWTLENNDLTVYQPNEAPSAQFEN